LTSAIADDGQEPDEQQEEGEEQAEAAHEGQHVDMVGV
jgi:hypothetical protein